MRSIAPLSLLLPPLLSALACSTGEERAGSFVPSSVALYVANQRTQECTPQNVPAVEFVREGAALSSRDGQRLAQLAACLDTGALRDAHVELWGAANLDTPTEYDRVIALARARAVRDVLVERGVSVDRIAVHALSEAEARSLSGVHLVIQVSPESAAVSASASPRQP